MGMGGNGDGNGLWEWEGIGREIVLPAHYYKVVGFLLHSFLLAVFFIDVLLHISETSSFASR